MKKIDELLKAIQEEYLELRQKIAKLSFALVAFPLDGRQKDLLTEQLEFMNSYADVLLRRVEDVVTHNEVE